MMIQVDNDTRGWIMAGVSGVACIVGASIICVDLVVQRIPRMSQWRVQDSDTFLSSSLALSFGVMIFSALSSMLPSAKAYLAEAGFNTSVASWILVSCFLGGLVAIGALSRVLHHFIPSHIVDCEHSHGQAFKGNQDTPSGLPKAEFSSTRSDQADRDEHEQSPLLDSNCSRHSKLGSTFPRQTRDYSVSAAPRRPSLSHNLTSTLRSFVSRSSLQTCGQQGSCHGYDELCAAQDCKFQTLKRSLSRPSRSDTFVVSNDHGRMSRPPIPEFIANPRVSVDEEAMLGLYGSGASHLDPRDRNAGAEAQKINQHQRSHSDSQAIVDPDEQTDTGTEPDPHTHKPNSMHHHHVHTNVFLSIGLQTSFAIALHKLPEGFITYATNHANPKLGFAVFMALFIHNITEGFALALPLYLALGSRTKAMLVASILGGASQPLGAGIAALWLTAAAKHDIAPSETVYGCMFAITSGIMTLVALQLFSESLSIGHSRTTCTIFGVLGMGILGISNALTAA